MPKLKGVELPNVADPPKGLGALPAWLLKGLLKPPAFPAPVPKANPAGAAGGAGGPVGVAGALPNTTGDGRGGCAGCADPPSPKVGAGGAGCGTAAGVPLAGSVLAWAVAAAGPPASTAPKVNGAGTVGGGPLVGTVAAFPKVAAAVRG